MDANKLDIILPASIRHTSKIIARSSSCRACPRRGLHQLIFLIPILEKGVVSFHQQKGKNTRKRLDPGTRQPAAEPLKSFGLSESSLTSTTDSVHDRGNPHHSPCLGFTFSLNNTNDAAKSLRLLSLLCFPLLLACFPLLCSSIFLFRTSPPPTKDNQELSSPFNTNH